MAPMLDRTLSGQSFDAIGIVNESTKVTADQARAIVEAVGIQVRADIARAWDRRSVPVRLYTTEKRVPADVALGVILDNSDQAGALGYHDETPDGRPYFRAFAEPSLEAGSGVLTGAYSVSATVSHEVAELLGDPACRTWVDSGDAAGTEYALELGDPVEAGSYPVVTKAGAVLVSNFVYPAWFDPQASTSSTFDHLHTVSRPFQMAPGGYVLKRTAADVIAQFGAEMPEWRRDLKLSSVSPVARTRRRLTELEPV